MSWWRVLKILFSYIYQIRAKDVPAAKPMRWEVEKALHLKVPQTGFVRIPPRSCCF